MDAIKNDVYAECKQLQRTKPDMRVNKEIAKEIESNYRTLPIMEKSLFDYIYLKHYSLQRNEYLGCRWTAYKKQIKERVPFQFVNIRDLHFHNGSVSFRPSESIYQYPEHRMKLRPGPGVDIRGQLPIPQELLMKRGKVEKQDGAKRKFIGKKKHESQD